MNRLILIFLILMPIAKADILITEIMANPLSDESLNEWIEIYNNDTKPIDVKNWVIGDDKDNDTLIGGLYGQEGTVIPPQSYAIITDYTTRVYDNFNINLNITRLYVDDESIGNGLRNEGETIWIYNNDLIAKVEYEKTAEGKSYSFYDSIWVESEPTPGYGNIPLIGCDWKVEVVTNQTFIGEPEWKIKVTKIYGEKNNLTLNRHVKNLFDEIIKDYQPLFIEDALYHRTFDYTPNIKPGAYTINAEINSSCDTNPENDLDIKTILVEAQKPEKESQIEITKVYDLGNDKKANWGQTIRVRLKVYKGDAGQKTVNLWVRKDEDRASKQTSTNIETKYTTTELTLPIQLKPNCDKKLKDGEYKITAEGLGSKTSKTVKIEGVDDTMCKVIELKSKEQPEEKKTKTEPVKKQDVPTEKKETTSYLNKENPTEITGNIIYESQDMKAKRSGIYFFCGVLALITISIVLKNGK